MGIPNIGVPSLILIIVVALIIFGPNKLPQIGKAAGQTFREFKDSVSGLVSDDTPKEKDEEKEDKKDQS